MSLVECETCFNGKLPSGHQCPECEGTGKVECEHREVCQDDRACLICGEDMTESMSCAAEDMLDLINDR